MKKVLRAIGLLLLTVVLFCTAVNLIVVFSAMGRILPEEKAPQADAILVLGASVIANSEPSPMLEDRILTGVDLYHAGAAPTIVMSGDHRRISELLIKNAQLHPGMGHYYEMAQYYMYLKQVPLGQAALEKAVENAPDNYWYAQGLANLYMQQNETEKAAALLENMAVRFSDKLDPLYNLLEIYNRQEEYDKVIGILNKLEERMGKNEQLSMEKFRIYLQKKDDKSAFHEIESLVEEYPNDMRYQVVLGDVYMQNGKKQEAYEIYKKVLAEEQMRKLQQKIAEVQRDY